MLKVLIVMLKLLTMDGTSTLAVATFVQTVKLDKQVARVKLIILGILLNANVNSVQKMIN
jgi:hypothetical protein